MSGCFFSPLVPNIAPASWPTPLADGTVTLTLKAPAEARSAQFRLRGAPEGFATPFDDSRDDDFVAQFDTRMLQSGVYVVDVYLDEDEVAFASLIFVKPEPTEPDSEAAN